MGMDVAGEQAATPIIQINDKITFNTRIISYASKGKVQAQVSWTWFYSSTNVGPDLFQPEYSEMLATRF
jgi:hypothetical protein